MFSHVLLLLSSFLTFRLGLHSFAPCLFSVFVVAVLLFIELPLRDVLSCSNSNIEVNVDIFEYFDKQKRHVPA